MEKEEEDERGNKKRKKAEARKRGVLGRQGCSTTEARRGEES